ncbi:MAG: anaerobic magnesium-protoporphyrin monomethyl ester cyclase [Actinomycetota bacterium]|nr:anaerobic magnesium-protoporphyrin monomethyl ester cyclase [Actinomycetota bacterium]
MKILLVNPHLPADPSTFLLHPPLGHGYLASRLRRAGHDVAHVDLPLTGNDPSVLVGVLDGFAADVVGVTSVAQSYAAALQVAAVAKQVRPDCWVVLGGPHVSFLPRECLRRHGCVDFVVTFDAETSFVDLCTALAAHVPTGHLTEVDGLAFRADDTTIVVTPAASPTRNLDALGHPDRTIFDMGAYLRRDYETVVMGARGCPGRCAFCSSNLAGRTYRWHSARHIADEVAQVLDLGFTSVFFGDDTFAGNSRRLDDFCNEIARRGIDVPWTCNIRAQDARPQLLDRMRAAGAYRVFVGFESIQADTLRLMRKGSSPGQMAEQASLIRRAGLELHASFIVGAPGDTHESLRETLDFVRVLDPTIATFNTMEPRPGTDVHANPGRYGICVPDPFWYETTAWLDGPVCSTQHLTAHEIKDWVARCYTAFCDPGTARPQQHPDGTSVGAETPTRSGAGR